MRVSDSIQVPALIITSDDDPFVPSAPFRDPKVTGNPYITLHLCEHGGHCGFVGNRTDDDDGYWEEHAIVDFMQAAVARVPDVPRAIVRTPAPSPPLHV